MTDSKSSPEVYGGQRNPVTGTGPEPSILDWFKSMLRGDPIPVAQEEAAKPVEERERVREVRSEIPAQAYETPLEEVGLSARVLNLLTDANYETAGAVLEKLALEEEAIRNIPGVGAKSVEEMQQTLEGYDYPEPEPEPVVDVEARLHLEPVQWGEGWLAPARLRLPAALLLAFGAQFRLTQQPDSGYLAAAVYIVAGILVGWAVWAGDVYLPAGVNRDREELGAEVRTRPLAVGVGFAALAFLTAFGNQFRTITVVSWVAAFFFTFVGLWEGELPWNDWWPRFRAWIGDPELNIQVSGWHFLLLGSLAVVAYFRVAEMTTVPYEMWSDQAEKLLDVRDVLNGDHRIFFPRNSGREAVEFYWAALIAQVFGTGLSFLTLKLVTIPAGILALPFIYLLAKEVGGREAGLYAFLLAGVAFWPNITSRLGLRMPLNELAVAPAMFFLVRGLRSGRRNDFLWSGLAVGLGLQGYSGSRVLPGVIVLGVLIFLAHLDRSRARARTIIALGCLVLVSIIGALPLLRVVVDMPDQVLYRTMTRLGTLEQPYARPWPAQLAINMWDVMTMFARNTGEIWVATVPNRPALDLITGGLFHLGGVILAVDYVRNRRWESLFILLSLPILLLPSALALAFPNENPAPNRVTGAIVPVFTIAAYGLMTAARWVRTQLPSDRREFAAVPVVILLILAGMINHRLVFETYADRQKMSSWNASEAGEVMQGFVDAYGRYDDVYFVVYPHWVDSRLVAIEAGAPIRDYSIWPEDLPDQELDPSRFHLYFIKPEDVDTMQLLQELHPNGVLKLFRSSVPGRDFYLFTVPAKSDVPEL